MLHNLVESLNIIPLVALSEEFLFFLFILARVVGLLILSPLLANKPITISIRIILSLFTALVLSVALYGDYYGPTKQFNLGVFPSDYAQEVFVIGLAFGKELAIGYLIGFCFNILFEAMLLAGDLIDAMIGFTTAQFIDPITMTIQSLLAQVLMLVAFLLMLAMDLHHLFFRTLAESFSMLPLGNYQFAFAPMEGIVLGASMIFTFGFKVAAIPFVVLSLATICIGFVSRALPEFNPLLTGIAVRIVIGLFTLIGTLNYLPSLIQYMFLNLNEFTLNFLKNYQ